MVKIAQYPHDTLPKTQGYFVADKLSANQNKLNKQVMNSENRWKDLSFEQRSILTYVDNNIKNVEFYNTRNIQLESDYDTRINNNNKLHNVMIEVKMLEGKVSNDINSQAELNLESMKLLRTLYSTINADQEFGGIYGVSNRCLDITTNAHLAVVDDGNGLTALNTNNSDIQKASIATGIVELSLSNSDTLYQQYYSPADLKNAIASLQVLNSDITSPATFTGLNTLAARKTEAAKYIPAGIKESDDIIISNVKAKDQIKNATSTNNNEATELNQFKDKSFRYDLVEFYQNFTQLQYNQMALQALLTSIQQITKQRISQSV
ncbi:MAG: hypothetical protein AB8B67_04885 [Rickettsiaceae bacterium]